MKAFSLTLLFIVLAISGCAKHEISLRDKIIGHWQIDLGSIKSSVVDRAKPNKSEFEMIMTNFRTTDLAFQPDGTFGLQSAVSADHITGKWSLNGTALQMQFADLKPGQPVPKYVLNSNADRIHVSSPGFDMDFIKTPKR